MSHPAASIKSIISGKTNLDTPEFDAFESGTSFEDLGNGNRIPDFDDDISSKFSHDSNYSVTSRNILNLSNTNPPSYTTYQSKLVDKDFYRQNSSTNISLASSNSEYQQDVSTKVEFSTPLHPNTSSELGKNGGGTLPLETNSRPLSRNSTTSCLSTTATKDGVEGKKLHRSGPTAYSSNIIVSMLQNQGQLQQQQQPQPRSVQPQPSRYYFDPSSPLANKNLDIQRNFHDGLDKPPPRKSQVVSSDQSPSSAYLAPENDVLSMDHDTPMEKPNNFSQASVYSTSAQVDGDEGKKYAVDITQFSDSVPPVSLKEKIDMIDTDNITPKEK